MPAEPSAKGARRSLRIGKYDVEAPITLGGLGSAYRAADAAAGRAVALKVLPPELSGSIAARDRFLREANKASRVRSANVVRVLDFGDASGTWFLALELADGPSLADHVRRKGALGAGAARDVVVQAARALDLLHREGLVPRDLSAGNFVVTRGPDDDGRLAVKLLDLGLLRPAADDAPADVRAALAALGGTFYFLLTGRSEGKPDLGALSSDVPDDLRAVLRRLTAQRPEERYPTPAALLEALGEEEPTEPGPEGPAETAAPVNALAALAEVEDDGVREPKPPRRRGEARPPRRRGEEDAKGKEKAEETPAEDEEAKAKPAGKVKAAPAAPAGNRKALVWGGAAVVALLAVGALVIVALSGGGTPPKDNRRAQNDTKKADDGGPDKPADSGKGAGQKGPDPDKPGGQGEQPAGPPALYVPKEPLARARLNKEYEGPWSKAPQPPADAPVFYVARVPLAGGKPGTTFDSVAAACAAIPEGKWGVVEVLDDGPIFEGPIRVTGRNVVIRGGLRYSPLLVWDVAKAGPKGGASAFLSVEKGSLLLGNVGLAVDWPEGAAGGDCLVRVAGGDFVAWNSTFSVAGKPRAPLAVVRFEGGAGKKCRLSHCFVRGAHMTALDLPAAGADVMIDASLLAGGEPPLLAVAGGTRAEHTTLRVIRSTLLGRDTAVQVRPCADEKEEPVLHWLGWDALLWRAGEGAGGIMVDLPKEANGKGMSWRAVNCLYAGWQTLLSGREPLAGGDTDGWHVAFNIPEGDVSLAQMWVLALPLDPAEALPGLYRTDRADGGYTPVGFAATFSPGLLGCDLSYLPWVRPHWLDLTTRRARPPEAEMLEGDAPLEIPKADDGLYHGERLDLDTVDLGARLRDVQKKQKLAPLVVLHLHGTGKRKTSPVRVQNAHLYLYFEPAEEGAEPLVLTPDPELTPDGNALVEVANGNLWLLGGDVRCPDFKTALLPHYLVMVTGGHLFLTDTRLQGPVAQPPDSYWGLVRVEGTGSLRRGEQAQASVNRCVLLSARVCLHLAGAGLRAHLRQSLVVATGRALQVQLGLPQKEVPGYPTPAGSLMELQQLFGEAHVNVQATADHCTFAAKEAFVYLEDVPVKTDAPPYLWPVVADPILVQTSDCAFLNPFVDKGKDGKPSPAEPALLAYTGAAVQRGLLAWRSEGDVYDKRLHAYLAAAGAGGKLVRPEKPQPNALWERLWGPLGDHKPILDVPLRATLDPEKLPLDQLALPAHESLKATKPGADLVKLKLVKAAK